MARRPETETPAAPTADPAAPDAGRPDLFKQSEFVDSLLEALPVSAWVKNADGMMLACNSRCAADFGRHKSELIGRLSPEFDSPELRERARRTDAELIARRKSVSYEARQPRDDGSYRYGIVTKSPFLNPDGSIGGIIGVVTDITDRKRGEEAMQLAAQVFEHSVEGIYIANGENRIIRINPAFTAITGYTAADVAGRNPMTLERIQERPEVFDEVWDAVSSEGIWRGELMSRRRSGELFPAWVTIIALKDSEGQPTHYIGIFRDITEWKATADRMRWLAHHDYLTGLANRSLMEDRLDQVLRRARRDRGTAAIMLIDLDGFKPINDQFGHHVGDHLLKATARRLVDSVRQTDTVARLGGDEFVVIVPDIGGRNEVERLAGKLLATLTELVQCESESLSVGVSMGISLVPEHGDTADELLRIADAAMYHVKNQEGSAFHICIDESR